MTDASQKLTGGEPLTPDQLAEHSPELKKIAAAVRKIFARGTAARSRFHIGQMVCSMVAGRVFAPLVDRGGRPANFASLHP
jgi:hypothetical protein